MQLHEASAVRVEPLSTFFPELCTHAISCSRRLGCLRPKECGTDAVTKFIMDESKSGAGRVAIVGEQIALNFPNARDQRKVAAAFVKLEVRSAHHRCQDCRYLRKGCQVSEDYARGEDGEPRGGRVVPCSPKTPEEICADNERLKNLILATPRKQRRALIDRIMGYSFEQIAQRLHKNPEAVRKGFARLRPKVEHLFGKRRRGGR